MWEFTIHNEQFVFGINKQIILVHCNDEREFSM